MPEIGTYSNTYAPFTPINILPEPTDLVTWDWMETISQFSQRFTRIATTVGTVSNASPKIVFDYSSLNCDIMPPIIGVCRYAGTSSQWVSGKDFSWFINGLNLNVGTFWLNEAITGVLVVKLTAYQ